MKKIINQPESKAPVEAGPDAATIFAAQQMIVADSSLEAYWRAWWPDSY
jgi:hypothetical protein